MSDPEVVVELGFIEKVPPWKLCSKFFPSKVGGYPAWLALKDLPTLEELSCRRCNNPLVFLCQLYAPFHHKKDSFHRTVFMFVCCDPECCQDNDAANIRIFRCQLPRSNDFYPADPPKEVEEGSDRPGAGDYNKLCRVCGALGPKVCGGCRVARYCSKHHQAMDWKTAHKTQCKNPDCVSGTSGASKVLFPEFEVELEPEVMDVGHEKSEAEVIQEYEDLLRSSLPSHQEDLDSDTENDLVGMASKETDKQFRKFRTRIKEFPDQVVRYDRGKEPLWVSSQNKPGEVPPCPHCGQPRQFEFQVMPQLLVHLKVDNPSRSIDWGTVLVYSCSDSCSQAPRSYVEELAYKQDYSPIDSVMKSRT